MPGAPRAPQQRKWHVQALPQPFSSNCSSSPCSRYPTLLIPTQTSSATRVAAASKRAKEAQKSELQALWPPKTTSCNSCGQTAEQKKGCREARGRGKKRKSFQSKGVTALFSWGPVLFVSHVAQKPPDCKPKSTTLLPATLKKTVVLQMAAVRLEPHEKCRRGTANTHSSNTTTATSGHAHVWQGRFDTASAQLSWQKPPLSGRRPRQPTRVFKLATPQEAKSGLGAYDPSPNFAAPPPAALEPLAPGSPPAGYYPLAGGGLMEAQHPKRTSSRMTSPETNVKSCGPRIHPFQSSQVNLFAEKSKVTHTLLFENYLLTKGPMKNILWTLCESIWDLC